MPAEDLGQVGEWGNPAEPYVQAKCPRRPLPFQPSSRLAVCNLLRRPEVTRGEPVFVTLDARHPPMRGAYLPGVTLKNTSAILTQALRVTQALKEKKKKAARMQNNCLRARSPLTAGVTCPNMREEGGSPVAKIVS